WYNRPGFIDHSQARTKRQVPSILVSTLAEPLILHHFSNVSVSGWLPIFLACHLNENRRDLLRPAWYNMSAPLHVTTIEYPSHNRKKTGTTKQALLTNHRPGTHVRRLPSESTTLASLLIIYCTSVVSFSGWLPIFLACHLNENRRDLLRPAWYNMSAPLHVTTLHHV
uniref:ORM1-like protein 2 n=1 Tax=Mesocestoides corti TaxID=53468 RepID=A0A5K3G3C4_MESCO